MSIRIAVNYIEAANKELGEVLSALDLTGLAPRLRHKVAEARGLLQDADLSINPKYRPSRRPR